MEFKVIAITVIITVIMIITVVRMMINKRNEIKNRANGAHVGQEGCLYSVLSRVVCLLERLKVYETCGNCRTTVVGSSGAGEKDTGTT